MIIDAHTHVWPDRIAAKALAGRVPGMEALGDGTISGLRRSMDETGVDHCVAFGIADHARHVERANEFISSRATDRLTPFGTVHLDLSVEENMDSLARHGIKGVKLHPLFQRFALDDRRLWALFDAFGSDIAVIAHVGFGGEGSANDNSTPQMLADVVRNFPRLRLMACHFGGFRRLDEAERYVVGLPVVLETSWPPSLAEIPTERLRRIVRRHGPERMVFGSDWPMVDPAAEIEAIRRLELHEDDEAAILGGNLAEIIGVGG
ncbi:amidohydrolase family protein [Spinactinospora alkalitolerans]|nr:amidohydrolase family protein [Spinactinospora alkalitolerans]